MRLAAIKQNTEHYSDIFRNGKDEYAIPKNSLTDNEKIRKLNAFFFWSSWAASTNRIGDNVTYTNNWPHEELVGNVPTPDTIVWTGVSIILLLLGIGGMALYYAANKGEVVHTQVPADDPLLGALTTPSQRAVVKYFWVVSGLFLLQIIFGVITVHYGVEGGAFLRNSDCGNHSLCNYKNLAYSVRNILDSNRMACCGFIHSSGSKRS